MAKIFVEIRKDGLEIRDEDKEIVHKKWVKREREKEEYTHFCSIR